MSNLSNGRMLIVRADSGSVLGSGHVSRMAALGHAWRSAGGRAMLVGNHGAGAPIGWPPAGVNSIAATYPAPGDIRQMLALVAHHPGCCVACDGYHFDAKYTDELRGAGTPVLQMDDAASLLAYRPDVLVNQNSSAASLSYCTADWTKRLFGSEYALLRPEFTASARRERMIADRGRSVLVTLGGGRRTEQLRQIIDTLAALRREDLSVHILPGSGSSDEVAAIARHARFESFSVVSHPADVPAAMQAADLAISAAGSTCWELCYTGTPQILLVLAENQQGIAADLAARGVASNLGPFEGVDPDSVGAEISRLLDDRERRTEMSQRGQALVDGRGAERVVEVFSQIAVAVHAGRWH